LCGEAKHSIAYGIQYARIRSFAAPFALPTIVIQAAFLALKDSLTPLKAVFLGAVVNVLGDLFLVNVCGAGVAGAAAATAASQIVGAAYLMLVGWSKIVHESNLSTHNWATKWETLLGYIRFPSMRNMKSYLTFCGPYFLILLMRTVLWTFTFFACSSAGVVELAAHQITINIFLFFCIFGEVTSQISQTYLPLFLSNVRYKRASINSRPNVESIPINTTVPHFVNEHNSSEIKSTNALSSLFGVEEMVSKVTKMGISIGIASYLACMLLGEFGYKYFTKSAEVLGKLKSVSGLLALSTLPYALMLGLEGDNLACLFICF